MEKTDATIIKVLKTLNKPVHRTKLVKLIYLIDELYYSHFGDTITGLEYMWDNYGPNAVGNAIVDRADTLASKGIIHVLPYPNIYGDTSFLYGLDKADIDIDNKLSEAERYVIVDVVCHYAKASVNSIVSASKRTESFKDAKQYQVIELKKSREYEELLKEVNGDLEFIEGINQAVQELSQSKVEV